MYQSPQWCECLALRENFLLHIPEGIELCHMCMVPSTFEQFLSKFNSKKRYNLKRQVRILRGFGSGKLELRRIESCDDLPVFLEAMGAVTPRITNGCNRQHDLKEYARLAEAARRGVLRCYTLKCGDHYLAWLRGYMHRGIYHLELTCYDRNFARFSPGTVLLFLVVEDLIQHESVQMISFGYGDPAYKHQSSNTIIPYARVLLLRKSFANRFRQVSHLGFRQAVKFLRRRILPTNAAPITTDGSRSPPSS